MAEQTLKVDVSTTVSEDAKQISKLGTEAKNSARIFTNLRAGGQGTVTALKAMNDALHGSTQGILQLAGQLGALAGPGAVVALVVKSLRDLDASAKETARKMHQAFENIGTSAGSIERRRVLEGGVTAEEKNKAETSIKDLEAQRTKAENRILELAALVDQRRAAGQPTQALAAQTEIKTLEKDIADMTTQIKEWKDVIETYSKQEKTKKDEADKRGTIIGSAFAEAARLMDSAGTPFQQATDTNQEEEQSIITATATKIDSMLNNLDKIGGYTSNLVNAQASPELQEMKTQTLKLNQIAENTKKTSARYAG